MKYAKTVLAGLLVLVVCTAFSFKKDRDRAVYVFGVSVSFTDSIVYYTEIQLLDSVFLDKQGFLPEREQYSYQMKNYLEYQQGVKNRTCVVCFSDNKSKLEKEQVKVMSKQNKNKTANIVLIDKSEFSFKKPADSFD